MKRSVKVALAATALAAAGGLFLVGSSFADRGPMGMMGHMGMMHGLGPMAHEMLKDVDTNSDGALSQDEINTAVDARFSQFDADHDGKLSLTEFEALWAEITKPMAVRAFQFLDPNGDATISKAELDDHFSHLVSSFDRNGDGALSPADRMGPPGGHGWRQRHDHGPRNGGQDSGDGGQQDDASPDNGSDAQ